MNRRIAALGIIGLCLWVLLVSGSTASAHVFLKSAQPPPDQVLAQAPTQVMLTFSGVLKAVGSQITVTDASGQHFETGAIALDPATNTTMTIALKPLVEGIYTVTYTAISDADGHETADNYQFGVGKVTLTPNAPNRACAMLPPLPTQTASQNASVRIVSPLDNSTLSTSRLDYVVNTSNYNLGSNGNYADVYVDGQKAQKIQDSGTHSLHLSGGIHDVCVSLVDGSSGIEVGARTGIRLLVQSNQPAQNSSAGILAVAAVLVALLAGLAYWRWWSVRRARNQ